MSRDAPQLTGAWQPSSSPTLSDERVRALPSFRFDADGRLVEWDPVFRGFLAGTHSLTSDDEGQTLVCETEARAVYRVLSRRDDTLALQGPNTARDLVYYRRLDAAAENERFGRYRRRP